MPKIKTFIMPNALAEIKCISTNESKTLEAVAGELIEIGLKVRRHRQDLSNEEALKKLELKSKHTEYLLRIITMCDDILRCTFKADKVALKGKNVTEELQHIKQETKNFIGYYTKKPS